MDLRDPDPPDATDQNRRTFLQTTGIAGLAATFGLGSGERASAEAVDKSGSFTADPFTLGVASGDPLPDSVIIWTRLAPNPLIEGGGMPDEPAEVQWTVATNEEMTDVVTSGTATAEPEHAHTIHVDADGLEPNTEYYYQFESRGKTSPVGRTKTAPAADATIEEFEFAFASCNSWDSGFYTPYFHMAEEKLDLVIHLGDYLYEYGIGPNGGVRDTSVPQQFRSETVSLERYRLQYGLYKSAPGMRAAHASAPWLVTRDDHEVDNNWAGDIPQDPEDQPIDEFVERRAAAFKAYYEHMPFRMEQKPDEANQKLYRNYSFGDLVEFNVLDTRLYRDDQACDDVFNKPDCEERFEEDRTILGEGQREWLLNNLRTSTATWDVLANQLPFARMDFLRGEKEGFRTEQWDGYVADQNTVKRAFEEDAENPVVITGDFHSNWANEIRSADDFSDTVGVEFVGTSISSSGDGSTFDDFNGDAEGVLGKHVIRENDNVYYNLNRRGYARCRVTPEEWTTDYKVVDYVSEPGAPIYTDATFRVEAGTPALQAPPLTVTADSVAVANGRTGDIDLSARWLPDGFAGGEITVALTEPDVARFDEVTAAEAFELTETSISDDGSTATIRVVDIEDNVAPVVAGAEVVSLAALTIDGIGAGTSDIDVTVQEATDDDGDALDARTSEGVVVVGPPPVDGRAPTDPDGDGRYEDLNGNGRLDYDDVTTLFENFEADSVRLNEAAYDFNENGQLDYDDIVTLYEEIN